MKNRIEKLNPENQEDFYKVHSAENDAAFCQCIYWWLEDRSGFMHRTKEENLEVRKGLFEKGEFDIYVAYSDNVPVGTCQVALRDNLQGIVNYYKLDPDPEVYAITCFLIAPEFRRKGISKLLLNGILDQLKDQGVKRVEAYPKRTDSTVEGELWVGPMKLYSDAGFEVLRDFERTSVMSKSLK